MRKQSIVALLLATAMIAATTCAIMSIAAESQGRTRAELRKMILTGLDRAFEHEIADNFHNLCAAKRLDAPSINRFVTSCELVSDAYLQAWKRLTRTAGPG